MPVDIKSHIKSRIESGSECYVKDFEAMSAEALAEAKGGARTAYDFTYETAFVNHRIARRLCGETPEPMADEGWMTAPQEYQDKAKLGAYLKESVDAVLSAWEKFPEDRLDEKVGPESDWTYLGLGSLCATHLMYHDAQLNYIQQQNGDMDMHWM